VCGRATLPDGRVQARYTRGADRGFRSFGGRRPLLGSGSERAEPTLESAPAALAPDAAAAATAALRAEGGTAAQLRAGAVTHVDLEGACLSADARAAVAAWRAAPPRRDPRPGSRVAGGDWQARGRT
jgi:hypothetical protein